ncbi:MAG: AbiV family abortive infection protein [Dehalococcoidia bacterium]|nr:MAG: AbiV family abortive infection protein [Dehalococcoidia bacterium]
MNAAIDNAARLAHDARILLESHSYPSAASLAILSIEESGKVAMLRELALARGECERTDAWRGYRSHTRKNFMWLLPELAVQGARKLSDFRKLTDPSSDHRYILDQVKQIGFYTDCLGASHWSLPHEVIDKTLASLLVDVASLLATKHHATTKEVELWIKHMQPVWRTSPVWMEAALKNWYADMQAHGLVPPGDNEMAAFATFVDQAIDQPNNRTGDICPSA